MNLLGWFSLGCAALVVVPSSARAQTAAVTGTPSSKPDLGQSQPFTQAPAPARTRTSGTRAEIFQSYQRALEARNLSTGVSLSRPRLQEELAKIEAELNSGRRDEAITALVSLVESSRFAAFASAEEGRAAVFLLGDALGRAGAHEPARAYLVRLFERGGIDAWTRRAVHTLVDLALESDVPEPFLKDLERVPKPTPPELRGDIEYLQGRTAEWRGKPGAALASYARVGEHSRFWAQATYLSGVIEVGRKNFGKGEELFCKVAEPKRTPKRAALFGGSDFFRVRDLARLGLGRIAHEQYRFDDARYYYYLVPSDSERLPEALYETATTRYEAKDYEGAREAIDELKRLNLQHPYQDEAYILDAYIDLASCRFPDADRKLTDFLARYGPARDGLQKLLSDDAAMRRLVEAVQKDADPALAGLGVPDPSARALGMLLRVDAGYGRAKRRLAQLDHQRSGLRGSMRELEEAALRLKAPGEVRPRSDTPLGQRPRDKLDRIESQIAELKRLIRDAGGSSRKASAELRDLGRDLQALELGARSLRRQLEPQVSPVAAPAADLPGLISADRELAARLHADTVALREAVEKEQLALARSAFERLERRLTRLLNRARLGRIETVLGKKRALEVEVEALSQGLLPKTIVDSLRAERYLQDDEEYWPFEGEDWEDEYVGGEGLR